MSRNRAAQTLFTAAPLPQAPLDDAQRLACLRLIRSENVGPVTFRELINHFGGASVALEALPELAMRAGRKRPIRICPRETAESELVAAARIGARPLFTIEPNYPLPLASIAIPPPLIYVKGRPELLVRPAVAIVGARNASAAGIKLTRHFSTRLGEAGYVVASGLARGIDGAAHQTALPTGTVAVLAGGIDFVYPSEHAELFTAIGRDGCLVSEMPPGFQPRGQDFPRRNRIISGISLATVIMEAAHRSGSLITARTAAEQGREVLAVPGHPLDPRAEGTNALIKQGATMVTRPEDILEALAPLVASRDPGATVTPRPAGSTPPGKRPLEAGAPESAPRSPATGDGAATSRLLEALGPDPVDLDELARIAGLDSRTVRVALLELALAGRIEHHGSHLVSLKSPD